MSDTAELPIHHIILEDLKEITSNTRIDWRKLKSKTVLITGASGLIGSYLVYTLLYLNERNDMGIKVLALIRNREKAVAQYSALLKRHDFTLILQDVAKPFESSEKIDFIIHTASQTNPKGMMADPVGTITANAVGTLNMLEAAKKNNATFLYLSSREIYGNTNPEKTSISETDYGIFDHTLVRSCYPESKRMSETLCSAYNHQYQVQTKIARLSHVYGPDYNLGMGRVWGEFLVNEARRENIILKSDGQASLAFMYIRDAIAGLFFVLFHGDEMVYNISDAKSIVKITELAELVANLSPEKNLKPIFEITDGSEYSKNTAAYLDSTKIEQLGWKPSVELPEGLRRTSLVFSDYMKERS